MLDYNTQRDKLVMPEYGRYVQNMVGKVKVIPDKRKRSEQVRTVINTMAILNPSSQEGLNYIHKLWDHIHVISNYDLDLDDLPFPPPVKASLETKPHEIRVEKSPLSARHYGRNIQNMVAAIAARPDDNERMQLVMAMAHYMRKQYLIWNKDTVADHTIFNDIFLLSHGKLKVPEGMKLTELHGEYKQPNSALAAPPQRPQWMTGKAKNKNKNKNKNKIKKN